MSNRPHKYIIKWRPDKETPWVIMLENNKKEKTFVSKVIFEVRSETVNGNIKAIGSLYLKDNIATIRIDDDF